MSQSLVIKEIDALKALEKHLNEDGTVTMRPDEILDVISQDVNGSHAQAVHGFLKSFGEPVRDDFGPIELSKLRLCANLIAEEFFEVMETFGSDGIDILDYALAPITVKVNSHRVNKYVNGINLPIKPIEETLKELIDLEYVTLNLVAYLGLHKYADEAFNEVHWSNLSKGYASLNSAEEALTEINQENGKDYARIVKPNPDEDWFVIKRHFDDKIIKGKFYSKADIKQILKK